MVIVQPGNSIVSSVKDLYSLLLLIAFPLV